MKQIIFTHKHNTKYMFHNNYNDFINSPKALFYGYEDTKRERNIFVIAEDDEGEYLYHPLNGIIKIKKKPKGTFYQFDSIEELFNWMLKKEIKNQDNKDKTITCPYGFIFGKDWTATEECDLCNFYKACKNEFDNIEKCEE